MAQFYRQSGEGDPDPIAAVPPRIVRELLDPYDERTMIIEGGRVLVVPEKVLAKVQHKMERIDLDPDTAWAMLDVMSNDEMAVLFAQLDHGPTVVISTAEYARQIFGRWPRDLVQRPIPPSARIHEFLTGLTNIDVPSQDRARRIINRAVRSSDEVRAHPELCDLDPYELMDTWMALVLWFAIKSVLISEAAP